MSDEFHEFQIWRKIWNSWNSLSLGILPLAAALAHLKVRKVLTHRATYYKVALHEIVKAGALA